MSENKDMPAPQQPTGERNEQASNRGKTNPERAAALHILKTLNESNKQLIGRIVMVLGAQEALTFLQETLALEAAGGLQTLDGSRRRTPGGAFIALVRERATQSQREMIWPWLKRCRQRKSGEPNGSQPVPPPRPQLVWANWAGIVQRALTRRGEATTVKLTVIGRPGKVVMQEHYVVTTLPTAERVPTLPRGVPTPPNQPMTCVVYIARKQWKKVAEYIKDPDDVLIVEGFPTLDPELATLSLFATLVTTKHQQAARRQLQREQQR
jgi:hypothetical protein